MKIDRVIFCLNDNETYTGFWNPFSRVWSQKFDIKPTVIFVGTEQELEKNNLSEQWGDIVRLDPIPEVVVNPTLDWSVTWALFYGPTLFPDEVCMTSGIDQLPLSTKFFDIINKHDNDKYVVGFAGACLELPHICPSSHHVAMGEMFKEIYEIEESWRLEVSKVYSQREKYDRLEDGSFWGLDEAYSSDLLMHCENPNIVYENIFHNRWNPYRLCRSRNISYNPDKLKRGYYSELHSVRPYEQHKEYIDGLVRVLLDV
jgi:hypothetical protein